MPAFDCYKHVHDTGAYLASYVLKRDTSVVSSDVIVSEQLLIEKCSYK